MSAYLDSLKERLGVAMEELSRSPYLEKVLAPGTADKNLYAMYMIETYHYTRHNTRNQALVATRDEELEIRYMKFCLKHAEEEAGHELMAFHDLKSLGVKASLSDLPKPLDNTQVLIAYLYHVALKEHAYARLGYSFWAERVYGFIRPLLSMVSGEMGIQKSAMTFFNEHSTIDEDHARQVDEAIVRFVTDDAAYIAVENCMVTSLKLTARMMDEVFEQFLAHKEGKTTRYDQLLNSMRSC